MPITPDPSSLVDGLDPSPPGAGEAIPPAASAPLRLLVVADDERDYTQMLHRIVSELAAAGERVDSEPALRAALSRQAWDVILSDYKLKGFDASATLSAVAASGADCPVIVVSSAIGEDRAAEILHAGAHDVVSKQNLDRLPRAIRRELANAAARRARREAEAALRDSEERLRQLSRRPLRLQDEERRHLAKELHDSTAQELAALAMNLGAMRQILGPGDHALGELLDESLATTEQCIRGVRTMSYLLHPPLLDELGLVSALRHYAEGFMRRSGIAVTLRIDRDFPRHDYESERTLFRVVQESLGNIHRHSGSAVATITLGCDARSIRLEVSDDGCGFPPDLLLGLDRCAVPLGVGILGMRERLQQLGGRLVLAAGARGAVVSAEIPIRVSA